MTFLQNPINQLGISVLNVFLAYFNISQGAVGIGIICAMCAGWGLRQAALQFTLNAIKKEKDSKNDSDLV